MIMNITPRYSDSLHNALHFLATALLDKAYSQHDTEELGCLLLILADYSYLCEHSKD